jgi:hypothetical protein
MLEMAMMKLMMIKKCEGAVRWKIMNNVDGSSDTERCSTRLNDKWHVVA